MKVGFIVECTLEGPEAKVIPRLAALVNPLVDSEVETLGSKPTVLTDCGRYAKALLEKSKCERVVVIWDARPPWEEMNVEFTPEEEREKALASLKSVGLAKDKRVTLICLIEELEAWLLTDGRGVTWRINELRGKGPKLKKGISDTKNVERVNWPKSVMEKIFRTNNVRAYDDWQDASRIADGIPDGKRLLRHSTVFTTFANALS